MPAQHPTDRRLVALIDGELDDDDAREVRAHLEDCALCQLRAGQARTTTRLAVPVTFETKDVLAPQGAFEDRMAAPVQGDVWRLVWNDVNELGVVDRVDADRHRISVMPVLSDVDDADEWCGLTQLEALHDVIPVAVSVALEASIPWSVLDARVGHITSMPGLNLLRAAYKRGVDSAEGELERGEPVFSSLDPRVELLDELNDAFHVLAEAWWGTEVEAAPAAPAPELSIDTLLGAGLAPNRALALVRGDSTPSEDEAVLLGHFTGVSLNVQGRAIPPGLRRELDEPRWRPRVRARMAQTHREETDERIAVAYEALQPLAARGTHGEQADWVAVLEAILG
jgi:hypothetical protein